MSDNNFWPINLAGEPVGLEIARREPSHIHVARPGRVQRTDAQTQAAHSHAAYVHATIDDPMQADSFREPALEAAA
jgi:hypothetical protein